MLRISTPPMIAPKDKALTDQGFIEVMVTRRIELISTIRCQVIENSAASRDRSRAPGLKVDHLRGPPFGALTSS